MKRKLGAIAAAFFLSLAGGARCLPARADQTGGAVALFLMEDHGGRIPAYGGAGAALYGSLFAAQTNPASLAGLDRYEISLERDDIVLDIHSTYASIGGPLFSHAAWGLSYAGINYGTSPRTTVSDPYGISGATFDGKDMALALSLATRFGWQEQLAIGTSFKAIRLEIADIATTGTAFDLGLQWRPVIGGAPGPFRFGGSLTNIGPDVTFISAKESLPTTWRVGTAYQGSLWSASEAEVALDFVGGDAEDPHVRVGGGVRVFDRVTLRAGYDGGQETQQGLSGGLGINWENLNLDYVYIPYGAFGPRNRLSLEYRFGRGRGRRESIEEPLTSPTTVAARPAAETPPSAAVAPAPVRPIAASQRIFLYPPLGPPDALWKETFRRLATAEGIRLAGRDEAEARLDLLYLRRQEDGRWGGYVLIRDPSDAILATYEFSPPAGGPEEAADRIVRWLQGFASTH